MKKILLILFVINIVAFGQHYSIYKGGEIDNAVSDVRNKIWQQTIIESGLINVKAVTAASYNIDSSKIEVLIQIKTNASFTKLGSATILMRYDSTKLSYNNSPVDSVDYVFHNYSGGEYWTATVTKTGSDTVWLNIVLPVDGNATIVGNTWKDVVTLTFSVIGNPDPAELVFTWLTTSQYWAIFDSNNISLWNSKEINEQ